MRRGEIWTLAGGGDYTGKARPAIVVQDDRFDIVESITICPFTTDPTEGVYLRISVEPSEANGLEAASRIMVDKISTVRRSRLRTRVGHLDGPDLIRLDGALMVFLGLAEPRRRSRSLGHQ